MDRSTATTTSSTLRNASFSTYIRSDHDQPEDSELSIFDAKKYFNDFATNVTNKQISSANQHHQRRVINLQDIADQHPRLSSASSLDGYGRPYRARSFNATPTASSEASWNSKTGLLSNPPGAIAVSLRNPGTSSDQDKKSCAGSACKWLFGRKCPCSGKKSVQVEENLLEIKTPPHLCNKKQTQNQNSVEISSEKSNWIPNTHRIHTTSSIHENGFSSTLGRQRVLAMAGSTTGFTFPILNQTSPIKLTLNPPLEEPPRESLEIFQPSHNDNASTQLQQHRMLMLSRQSTNTTTATTLAAFPVSPKSRMTMTDDDVASDASSDLFEIESFSATQTTATTTTTTYPMYHRRDSLDEAASFNARRLYSGRSCMEEAMMPMAPSIAATECYEPSEASIDWSVTTAEGFDRGSVTNFSSVTAQEIDEMMRHDRDDHDHQTHQKKKNKNASGGGVVGGGRSSSTTSKTAAASSLLLSCRCEKAVSVGPNPVKCVAGESGPKHVNCRSSKPPLARSHSSRLSLPFAT